MIFKKNMTLIILIIFAMGTWVISQSFNKKAITERETVQPIENKFYLNSAKIINTDSSGVYLFTLQADYIEQESKESTEFYNVCLLYTSPSPRARTSSRMPSSA